MLIKRYINVATLVLVNFLWAAQYPAYRVASEHMSPATLNFWTLLCSSVLLLPVLFFLKRRGAAPSDRLDVRGVVDFVLLGVFGILPPSVLLAWGIAHSTASNAAIIQLTIPVLMVVLAVILLGERVTLLRVASLLIALAGTVIVSWQDFGGGVSGAGMLVGNVVVFISGFGSAFYNTYSKRLLNRYGELRVLIYTYLVACACCAAISMLDRVPFYVLRGYPRSVWLSIGVLGALTWGVAMALWMWVLKRLEAVQVSVSIYLLPVFGVFLSAVTLGERLRPPQIIGGLLVFVATLFASEYENWRKKARAPRTVALTEEIR